MATQERTINELNAATQVESDGPFSPEKAIEWVAAAVDRGLTRVYALNVDVSLESDCNDQLYSIDQMLEQANAVGRRETFSLVKAARFGSDVVVLSAPDASVDWVPAAVEKRLRKEMGALKLQIDASATQCLDLSRGEKLRLFGFELRYARSRGRSRAHYVRVDGGAEPSPRRASKKLAPHLRLALRRVNWGHVHNRWIHATLAGALVLGGLAYFLFLPTGERDFLRHERFVRPSGAKANYAIYVPSDYESAKHYPLIVFLHGSQRRGTDGHTQCSPGIGLAIRCALERQESFPFVVLFPHGPEGKWARGSDESRLVIELVDETCKKLKIDTDRMYLTGISSGGTGVWNVAADYPAQWAAVVPISSSPTPDLAPLVADLPCWCFHGKYDTAIVKSRAMIKAVEDAGGRPRFTEVPGMVHDVWNQAYLNQELYQWFNEHRRGG
jgi:poly(3-hydroxybutyrate) depolymerase